MVQQTINNCQDLQPVLVVLRWLEENLAEVVQCKPAVHLALVALQTLAAQSYNNRAWAGRLERFVLRFIKTRVREKQQITFPDFSFMKIISRT